MNSYIYIFPVCEYGDNGEYINLTCNSNKSQIISVPKIPLLL